MTLREELKLFTSYAWGKKSRANWFFNTIATPFSVAFLVFWFVTQCVLNGRKLD